MKKSRIAILSAGVLVLGIAIGAFSAGLVENIQAEVRRDFTVVIDGKTQTFKNANGEVVYPVLYDGTTYLPVRAIGELMGKTVYWYENDKRIELKSENGPTVTDADVIVDKNNNAQAGGGGGSAETGSWRDNVAVTLDAAKEAALKKAGLSAADVTFTKAQLDRDDGIVQYELEFYTSTNEYEADVDANTGEFRKWEVDTFRWDAGGQTGGGQTSNGDSVTVEEAKKIALERAGLSAADVTFTKAQLDRDDGVLKYEVEFRSGRTEYELEINAATGNIIKWKTDNH